jgi:predicted ABC-type ATPase
VRIGQHDVPPDDIQRRYYRSMENLPIAMRMAERTVVVDNTGRGFRLLMIRRGDLTRTYGRKLPAWALDAIPQELR